jgi:ferrous iron transport protein A
VLAKRASAPAEVGARIPLSQLPINQPCKVVSVAGDGNDPVSTRLTDLGFLVDTPVVALRRAPIGDPTIYLLRNYQMCLRRAETDRVIVEVTGTTESAGR